MTRYEQLCQALSKIQPRLLKVDEIVRELPAKTRQAISDELDAPKGPNRFLTELYEYTIGYVFHAREESDERGERTWKAVCDDHILQRGFDRIIRFGIGIALERPESPYFPTMFYLSFSVEKVSEDEVKLTLENRPGLITVRPGEPQGYSSVATAAVDWLAEALEDSNLSANERLAIGFGR